MKKTFSRDECKYGVNQYTNFNTIFLINNMLNRRCLHDKSSKLSYFLTQFNSKPNCNFESSFSLPQRPLGCALGAVSAWPGNQDPTCIAWRKVLAGFSPTCIVWIRTPEQNLQVLDDVKTALCLQGKPCVYVRGRGNGSRAEKCNDEWIWGWFG